MGMFDNLYGQQGGTTQAGGGQQVGVFPAPTLPMPGPTPVMPGPTPVMPVQPTPVQPMPVMPVQPTPNPLMARLQALKMQKDQLMQQVRAINEEIRSIKMELFPGGPKGGGSGIGGLFPTPIPPTPIPPTPIPQPIPQPIPRPPRS
jgi:hypothetical protein